ncbi:hypothetical protein KAT73_01280 [candidate division WOR-3 bacterium]|nr:hypothetical protein [candidate division WOR-3 bacterium]
MRIIKYLPAVIFIFLPFVAVSEDIAVLDEVGTEVLMETTYQTGKDITTKDRRVLKKQGNRVRMEELIEVEGKERLTSVSIYDGQSTWTISSKGKKVDEGFIDYPWAYTLEEDTGVESGRLEGMDVRIVDVAGGRLYLDPERDIIILDERGGCKTYYKDYSLVEDVGYIPGVIEEMDEQGNLIMKMEVKKVEQFKTFSDDTFNPDDVEIYIVPERRDVPD